MAAQGGGAVGVDDRRDQSVASRSPLSHLFLPFPLLLPSQQHPPMPNVTAMEATSTPTPMDPGTNISATTPAVKRKRSPSVGAPPSSTSAPAAKSARTSSQMNINYLVRQSTEDLPLVTKDDTLQNMLYLLSAYGSVLDRHESLASNLGARPLGPILIKRFERCFDSPPKIVASHHKNANSNSAEDTSHTITWLEVIEFARSHPGQFTLSTFSEGKRVCQFYYPQKQLRVQISEEDFLFINSGRCQELIPPLPIWEDEEKEVGTCDVLEVKLRELTNAADMVAARTRQLSHRLKGRRAAILDRRPESTSAKVNAPLTTATTTTLSTPALDSPNGFVAVNTANPANISTSTSPVNIAAASRTATGEPPEQPRILASSATVRNELLRHFESLPQNQGQSRTQSRHVIGSAGDGHSHSHNHKIHEGQDGAASNASSLSPTPYTVLSNEGLPGSNTTGQSRTHTMITSANSTSNRHSSITGGNAYSSGHAPSKHNFSRPLPPALESSQPFRPLCQAHMDGLPRGERVLPPCDRCRRLRMDCIKNLTSCAGCTRKHARCHWREVSRDELGALDHLMDAAYPESGYSPSHANGYSNGNPEIDDESDDDDSNPLEDLEALGDIEEQENQIREDEEGLRNARELARQGWEGSNVAERSMELGNGVADHSATHQPEVEDMESDRTNNGRPVHGALSPVAAPSPDVDHKIVPKQDVDHKAVSVESAPPEQDLKSTALGGFHAVNGTLPP